MLRGATEDEEAEGEAELEAAAEERDMAAGTTRARRRRGWSHADYTTGRRATVSGQWKVSGTFMRAGQCGSGWGWGCGAVQSCIVEFQSTAQLSSTRSLSSQFSSITHSQFSTVPVLVPAAAAACNGD